MPPGRQISLPWSTILPTGEISAAVPQRPHSAKSFLVSRYNGMKTHGVVQTRLDMSRSVRRSPVKVADTDNQRLYANHGIASEYFYR